MAATKLFLHHATSPADLGSTFLVRGADSAQGAAIAHAVTNSLAGPITGQYFPSTAPGIYVTDTLGGSSLVWLSKPLSASVTIAGTITPNIWCFESNPSANIGFQYEIFRWSAETGGIVSSVARSGAASNECNKTSSTLKTAPTVTPTSTTFSAGDRILIVVYNDDANGLTESGGRNWTIDYDGATPGAAGDTFFTFTETFTFVAGADTVNPLPAQGYTN
jgi:hypothetical protein